MRIAHFVMGRCNPESANGIDKTTYYLSSATAALGHEVRLFSMTSKPPLPVPGVEVSMYAPRFVAPTFLPGRVSDLLVGRNYFNVPPQLLDDLVAWRPDVLHLHFVLVPQNVHVARRARRAGIPYCVTLHGGMNPAANARNRLVKQVFRTLVDRRYLQAAAFVHAISAHDAGGAADLGLTSRLVTVPNGIDVTAHDAVEDAGLLRRRYPQLEGKRILLFLGRLDPTQKGLDVMLDGLSQATARGADDLALVLVGPDWRGNRATLEASARSLGIDDRVVFTGGAFGPEKLSLVAGCDVFVHPSRWEAGVPFSVLEAAALSRACLLAEGADPGAALVRAGAAFPTEPTAVSIADALLDIARRSSDELITMGKRARSVAERDFSWQSIASAIADAYAEAA